MNKFQTLLTLCAIELLAIAPVTAQNSDFLLATQRSESQNVPPVPGRVINHHGLVISPTPQSISVDASQKLDISKGIRLKDKQRKFAEDVDFLTLVPKGTTMSVDFGEKLAAKHQVKSLSGAYSLVIDKKGITVIGYDERGAFYGIQTLRQIVKQPIAKGGLPYLSVNDFPSLPMRGVVEGFYGTPWSHKVRKSLINLYGEYKMNTYIYGPKDDPYHRSPNWREAYPEKEAANLKELVALCKKNRVDFVWAIHPGEDIQWNDEDYHNLVNKFEKMYALGVRAFSIFFDDISGVGTNPERQTELLNRLNKEFVLAKGDVAPLIVCPTDYSKLWANPTPKGALSIYGQTLDPSVKVFWTGDVVCSDLTRSTMEWVNSRIKRPALFWWNFPVTDYARYIVMQGPTYGLDTSLTAQEMCGLTSNPMEYGEASKLALYGVADYSWNCKDYNPIDNWERGIEALVPDAKEAYRTFAIHSCDTETGYRRAESWETSTFRLEDYSEEKADKLAAEFVQITKVPETMEEKCANKDLLEELRPWLTEFGKLGERGLRTIELMKNFRAGSYPTFWSHYVQNKMTPDERKSYAAHKSGTMKLQPFYEKAMEDMARAFYKEVSGTLPNMPRPISTFPNISTTQSQLMLDGDSTTFYTSGVSQSKGSWTGLDLGSVRPVSEVSILQGRNSVNDVDYFDAAVLECSADGATWTALTDSLNKQYVIYWKGTPVQARFVRLRRLDSKKSNWASIRTFEVDPIRLESLGFKVESTDAKVVNAFDGNPTTSYQCTGTLTFGCPPKASALTLLMKIPASSTLTLQQCNKKGKVLSETSIDQPFYTFNIVKGATTIKIQGEAEIFEIIRE
jgi:hyaluronoglucosaminidase